MMYVVMKNIYYHGVLQKDVNDNIVEYKEGRM